MTPSVPPLRYRLRTPRITCRWGTLRPFESLWMLGQKLAALNHVLPPTISRVAFLHERVGRTFRVAANLGALSQLIGCETRALESVALGNLLGMRDPVRLDIFRSSQLRFCPDCLRLGFHSEIFQLRGLKACPQHGSRLQNACPVCLRQIDIDDCLPAPLTCACGRKLSESTPQTDAILAEEQFPKWGHHS
jgi:hypothetical protein